MRQTKQMRLWVVLLMTAAVLSGVAKCEQWYEPDSHLISDVQFEEYVMKDRSAFKIVKYFSPHCVYCRYLKQVVDLLKHERKWCFQIYDFNCAWYPQHCMQNVRSASFPYTAIHNTDGAIHEEIHGFYPEPVIRTIFERIEQHCQEATKKSTSSLTQQETTPNTQVKQPVVEESIQKNQEERNLPQQNKPQPPKQANFDQPEVHFQEQQIKIDSPQKQKISVPQQPKSQSSATDAYLKYLIYGATVLIAAFYFHKINKGKELESHPQHPHPSHQTSPLLDHITPAPQSPSTGIAGSEVQAILQAQSQLSEQIADEQL